MRFSDSRHLGTAHHDLLRVLHRLLAGRRQTVVEALGTGTGVAVTGGTRIHTGIFSCYQLDDAYRQSRPTALELIERIQSQSAARGLSGDDLPPVWRAT